MKPFIDLGTRNKGTYWEYVSAYSFVHTKLPITKYHIHSFLGVGTGEPNKHCHHIDVIKNTKKLLIKEFKEGKYTKDFFEKLDAVYSKPLEEIRRISKQDFSNDNNAVLIKKVDIITKDLAESHKPMLLALKSQYLDDFFRQELLKVLDDKEKNNKNKILEFTSMLLTPTRLTLAQQEEEQLFEIQSIFEKELKKKDKEAFEKLFERNDIKQKLKKIVQETGWFHMEYMQNPWDKEDYKQELWRRLQEQPLEGKKSPKQKIQEAKQAQQEFFNNHPNADFLKKLSFGLREYSIILDASKAMLVEGSYFARPLFTHVANKLGLKWRDMLFLTLPEIEELLEKDEKADKGLIKERKKHRAVLLKDGKITYCQGDEAARLGKELIQQEEAKDAKEVKGIIGYQGKVTGKVNLIRSINDKAKFNKGDVLVTHDGTAELTYFLKNACAIVTDQGGMISHAAIVAREMKTPCVVGTKVATKVFMDGDIVEVDALKGIVKLLKRE